MTAPDKPIGLWKAEKKDKNGNDFLIGKMPDGTKITIFKNNFKTAGTNQPDYKLSLGMPQKREESKPVAAPVDDELPF